ncbi:MAG: peptidase [Candidatus Methylomirabilales bacterium]
MGTLLFFLDGVGIGANDELHNPLVASGSPWFARLVRDSPAGPPGTHVVATDASLGVPGLPQSATGQTTILTGVNAARHVGRHVQGTCTPRLAALLADGSLFTQVAGCGLRATCANAFASPVGGRRLWFDSVTQTAVKAAGLSLRTLVDVERGQALYQDYTNRILRGRGLSVPLWSPEEAAERLALLTQAHDFTYYEFFLTDLAGHAQDRAWALDLLRGLDRLLTRLTQLLDPRADLLCLVSDHGNLEELRTRHHTPNQVPVIAWGRDARRVAAQVRSLPDIAPALLPHPAAALARP